MATSPRDRQQDLATVGSIDSIFDVRKDVNPISSNDEEDVKSSEQERDQVEEGVKNTEPSREELAYDTNKSFDSWVDQSDSDLSVFEDGELSDDENAEEATTETTADLPDSIIDIEEVSEETQKTAVDPPELIQSAEEEQNLMHANGDEYESIHSNSAATPGSDENIAPTDEQIENMMSSLRDCDTKGSAQESIIPIDMALDSRVVTETSARNHIAEKIVELDGVAIIIDAMEKWQQESMEFVDLATCVLVAITQIIPRACGSIAKNGLVGIVANAKKTPGSYFLCGNVLALLLNLSTVDEPLTKREVSTDDCIDFVTATMQAWPSKPYIQNCGASYFVRINQIQAELREEDSVTESSNVQEGEDIVQEGQEKIIEEEVKLKDVDLGQSEAPPDSSEENLVEPGEEPTCEEAEVQVVVEPEDGLTREETEVQVAVKPEDGVTGEGADVEVVAEAPDSGAAEPPVEPPTEAEIAIMLRKLRDSGNVQEAEACIKELEKSTDSRIIDSPKVRKRYTTKVEQQNGVATIIIALEKWHEKSEIFSYHAISLLVSLSKFVGKSRRSIAVIGCKTVLDTAKTFQDDYFMRGNILALLQNLSNVKDQSIKQEVAAEEYIDCVVETMEKWPKDGYIQSCGCDYFSRIGKMEGMVATFRRKEIDSLMGEVLDNFQDVDDDDVLARATNVMNMIHDEAEQNSFRLRKQEGQRS